MSGTLMVVNVHDAPVYRFRALFEETYRARFPHILYVVPAGTLVGADEDVLVTSVGLRSKIGYWREERACLCGNPELGSHPCDDHAKHLRLAWFLETMRREIMDYDSVLWTEMDCLMRPDVDAASIGALLEPARAGTHQFRAAMPLIRRVDPQTSEWPWALHASGWPSYEPAWPRMGASRIAFNWNRHSGENVSASNRPMFYGFAEWLLFRPFISADLAACCRMLSECWHEIALPSAVVWTTGLIREVPVSLYWGRDRQLTLSTLTDPFLDEEPPLFIHPAKFGIHGRNIPAGLKNAWRF